MAVTMRTRRAFLKTASATAAISAIGGIARPSLSFAPDRPQITHGLQSGDIDGESGVVWAAPTGRRACWSRSPPRTVFATS